MHGAAVPEELPGHRLLEVPRPLVHTHCRTDAVNLDVQHAGK
jgi:hypothetical protein